MKKTLKTAILSLAIVSSVGITALAVIGESKRGGNPGGTVYDTYIEGNKGIGYCYAATTTDRIEGNERVHAYVEIRNSSGYKIDYGSANTGDSRAYSGTINRVGGKSGYGSGGTASYSSVVHVSLF